MLVKILLLLFTNMLIVAIPITFERWIAFGEKNTLIKTVDLIGDAHKPFREIVNQPSRRRNLGVEKSYFTTAERTLLDTLRSISRRSEKSALLWEYVNLPYSSLLDQVFLFAGGHLLQNELYQTSLEFIDCDSYRNFLNPEFLFIITGRSNQGKEALLLQDFQRKLTDLASLDFQPFQQDLKNVERYASPAVKKFIIDIWTTFIRMIRTHILEEITHPILAKNSTISMREFKEILQKHPKEQEDFNKLLLEKLMELETIFKIYSTSSSHDIVYAGAAHCLNIGYILERALNYIQVITISPPSLASDDRFFFPLSERVWNYLVETPQKSFTRYKQYGNKALDEKLSKELIDEFANLFDQLQNGSLNQEALLKMLKSFFKKSDKTLFNFLEARDNNTNQTLLFGAIKRAMPLVVNYLIKKGARLTLQDKLGKSPLHYAAALPDPIIFNMIFARVDTFILDSQNKSPFDYVNPLWQKDIQAIRLQKVEKSQAKQQRTLQYHLKSFKQDLVTLLAFI